MPKQGIPEKPRPRLIPVAQYVRMSTEDQQYSIANQRDRICTYAKQRGFSIVRTYSEASIAWHLRAIARTGRMARPRQRSFEHKGGSLAPCGCFCCAASDCEGARSPIRGGRPRGIKNLSRLISELKIDNDGIEFAPIQQRNRSGYLAANVRRNGELVQGVGELLRSCSIG